MFHNQHEISNGRASRNLEREYAPPPMPTLGDCMPGGLEATTKNPISPSSDADSTRANPDVSPMRPAVVRQREPTASDAISVQERSDRARNEIGHLPSAKHRASVKDAGGNDWLRPRQEARRTVVRNHSTSRRDEPAAAGPSTMPSTLDASQPAIPVIIPELPRPISKASRAPSRAKRASKDVHAPPVMGEDGIFAPSQSGAEFGELDDGEGSAPMDISAPGSRAPSVAFRAEAEEEYAARVPGAREIARARKQGRAPGVEPESPLTRLRDRLARFEQERMQEDDFDANGAAAVGYRHRYRASPAAMDVDDDDEEEEDEQDDEPQYVEDPADVGISEPMMFRMDPFPAAQPRSSPSPSPPSSPPPSPRFSFDPLEAPGEDNGVPGFEDSTVPVSVYGVAGAIDGMARDGHIDGVNLEIVTDIRLNFRGAVCYIQAFRVDDCLDVSSMDVKILKAKVRRYLRALFNDPDWDPALIIMSADPKGKKRVRPGMISVACDEDDEVSIARIYTLRNYQFIRVGGLNMAVFPDSVPPSKYVGTVLDSEMTGEDLKVAGPTSWWADDDVKVLLANIARAHHMTEAALRKRLEASIEPKTDDFVVDGDTISVSRLYMDMTFMRPGEYRAFRSAIRRVVIRHTRRGDGVMRNPEIECDACTSISHHKTHCFTKSIPGWHRPVLNNSQHQVVPSTSGRGGRGGSNAGRSNNSRAQTRGRAAPQGRVGRPF